MIRCIVDTDSGPDDLMALAYLLASPLAKIEAITTAYGLAHTGRGAYNILRVLALCGQTDIPVYVGQDHPLSGTAAFPDRWRWLSNTLPGISLPETCGHAERQPAAKFLQQRARHGTAPVRILALGALTNLTGLCDAPCPALEDVVIMGGAFDVAGNVIDSGDFISPTRTAEWNMFADPLAARTVLTSEFAQLVIPLDATNNVKITPGFIDAFAALGPSPLHRMLCELFELVRPYAAVGSYYAWDPLAAVALLFPSVVTTRRHAIAVSLDTGTTRTAKSGPRKAIAVTADRDRWEVAFCDPFT